MMYRKWPTKRLRLTGKMPLLIMAVADYLVGRDKEIETERDHRLDFYAFADVEKAVLKRCLFIMTCNHSDNFAAWFLCLSSRQQKLYRNHGKIEWYMRYGKRRERNE